MKIKAIGRIIDFKADGDTGAFKAVFSTFNVIDDDGDVTLPGAFKDGEEVRISYWGHRWQDLPVGKGVIHADEKEAWVDGQFFLDTEGGRETYKTVKNLGSLQEWSYGCDILENSFGEFEGQKVQFLRSLKVHEVAPVLLGAGENTRTTDIKGAGAADATFLDAFEAALAVLRGKEGRRNSDADLGRIQRIHDLCGKLGAKCAGGEGNAEDQTGDGKSSGPGPSTYKASIDLDIAEAEAYE